MLQLGDLTSYNIAISLSDRVWEIVSRWDWFNKKTLGVQWVNSVDSIGGNIAEGFGRFHKKDKIKFYFNARGSVLETIHWLDRAKFRNLISQKDYDNLKNELEKLPREINNLISLTNRNLKK